MTDNRVNRIAVAAVAAAGALVLACASQQTAATMGMVGTAAGEVGVVNNLAAGVWMDSAGGVWLDSAGAMRVGGGTGLRIGLKPTDVGRMTDRNLLAHIELEDSLEIHFARIASHVTERPLVREFANRVIADHSDHLESAQTLASRSGITPARSPFDTLERPMVYRMTTRVDSLPRIDPFCREFVAAEIMLHKHILNDLTLIQDQASGTTATFVAESVPMVESHLAEAKRLAAELDRDRVKAGNAPKR